VLSFTKGGHTKSFPATFMRLDVAELANFPKEGAINLSVDLIRRLSPGPLSVMEFNEELDVQIIKKMSQFPLLGETVKDTWNAMCNFT
jgi:hypothetical protein